MENVSVFDMFKIGVGPSSSHTLGPWRAAEGWVAKLTQSNSLNEVVSVKVYLYGSLSLTGRGHATDIALIMGLTGSDPVNCSLEEIPTVMDRLVHQKHLKLGATTSIDFKPDHDLIFEKTFLPFHSNGMKFEASLRTGKMISDTYYSIGGGFVVHEGDTKVPTTGDDSFPYPIQNGKDLLGFCLQQKKSIWEIVWANEESVRSVDQIEQGLQQIWTTMIESMYTGCHTEGELPGGLNVRRRSYDMHKRLIGDVSYQNAEEWLTAIRKTEVKFRETLKWLGCFALAVNEVNASLGRVVTAPTNGSAGVIPAVLMYYLALENHEATLEEIKRFLLTASEIGSIFKKGATISAAMGGCQAEIGVSSAMAAGGLTELRGGTPEQVLVAAEIAMEHHLGLTCDPVNGLVQIPCIERNSMGALKAINAAELALETDASKTKISLDKVVSTMWDTAKDMSTRYKETSEGGLAVKVNVSDC